MLGHPIIWQPFPRPTPRPSPRSSQEGQPTKVVFLIGAPVFLLIGASPPRYTTPYGGMIPGCSYREFVFIKRLKTPLEILAKWAALFILNFNLK